MTPTRFDNRLLLTARAEPADPLSWLGARFRINKPRRLPVVLSQDYERIAIDTPPSRRFQDLFRLIEPAASPDDAAAPDRASLAKDAFATLPGGQLAQQAR